MRKAFVEQVALPEPRFRDGLGIRYVRTDGTDDPVEVLRPLWDVGMMQNAIRQRVSRLASFRQARFVPVRAAEVPRDDASTIEVVSDYMSGHRLSQYLEASKAGVVSIETSTAIYILRELLGALALLHESRGVTHGAVGPERILITPKGRVVVADYVLGPAIERLEFTRPRLWREFRIAIPAGKGQPRLDDKADVLQVAVTALALLMGRPIDIAEYPERIEALLASLGQTQKAAGRAPLPAAFVGWLKRALFKDPNGKFAHVSDARLSLEGVLSKQDAATGGASALKALADCFGRYAAALEAKAAAAAAEEARKAALAEQAAVQAALQEQAAAEAAAAPITELVPAFSVDPAAPPANGAAMQPSAPVPAAESDPPVGWRVPEARADEETLPTSPLIQLAAPAAAPEVEAFVEEVLDLAGIAGPEEPEPAAAACVAEEPGTPVPPVTAHALAPEIETADAVVEVLIDLRDLAASDQDIDVSEAMPAATDAETASGGVEAAPIDRAPAQALVAAVEPTIEVAPPAPVEAVDESASVEVAPATIERDGMPPYAAALEPVFENAEATPLVAPAEPIPADVEPSWLEAAGVPHVVDAVHPVALAPPSEPAETMAEALAALDTAPVPPQAPRGEVLPEWRLLADPVGATAPTIDVEVPTESLDELVAAFAAAIPAEAVSHGQRVDVSAEPPTVEHPAPAFEEDTPAAVVEPQRVEFETLPLERPVAAQEPGAPVFVMEAPDAETAAPGLAVEAPAAEPVSSMPGVERAEPVFEMPTGEPEASSVVMEPPAIMLKAAVPFLDAPAALSPPPVGAVSAEEPAATASASVLGEILGLQEAQAEAQAAVDSGHEAPPATPDVSAWSFVEELLHRDARFERHEAVEDGSITVAGRPDRTDSDEPAPAVDLAGPLAEQAAPAYGEAAQALEQAVPFLRRLTPALVHRPPVAEDALPAVDDRPPAAAEAVPPLPPDWYIEVGAAPVERAPAIADRNESALMPEAAAPPERPLPVFSEAARETGEVLPPGLGRPALPEPDEDLSGPVFPRVAPSVRRVRAEARRRRIARLRSGAVHAVQAAANGIASAIGAVARGVAAVFLGAGRGCVAAVGAVAAGVVALFTALAHGLGGLARATGAGAAAVARGVATVGAASLRGLTAAVRTAGTGVFWLVRAAAKTAGAVLGGIARGGGRGLRALAAGAVAALGMAATAAAAGFRTLGAAVGVGARGLGSGAAALGRAGSAAAAGVARLARTSAAGAGRTAGRAAGRTASAASAARGAAGRRASAAGKGFGHSLIALPRRLYYAVSDVADRLPRPVFRPWHLAAALLVMAAVAGVPYAKALLSTPKVEVGTIRVESARPDELVTIDGVPQGRPPVTASVPVGRHRIEVGRAGQMRAHDVEVAAGRQTLLEAAGPELKATGSMRVSTDPAGAEVLVDGMLQGTAPLTIENLAEGTHTLLVRDKSGSVRQTLQVKAGEATDASVQIRPGWLAVFAPVKLTVLEGGKPIGSTEGGRILISPGPHTVEVVSQAVGYRETRSFEIKPGQVSAVTIQMPPVTIEVVAPPEAEVFIDGQPVGQAPLGPLQVAVGTREITMRHPTLGERRQVVSVTFNAPVKVVFE